MGKMIELTDELFFDAAAVAKQAERSPEDQIEFWAQLGKFIDPLVGAHQAAMAAAIVEGGKTRSVAELIASVDTPEGKLRTREHLSSLPFPHFEAAPDAPGYLVRIEEDGTRTIGRFENRQFVVKRN